VADGFWILDHSRNEQSHRDAQREAFETQRIPPPISNHAIAARFFQPDEPLMLAINAALAVGAPLLLTGEPGTGKTQIAFWVAWHLGILDEEEESEKNRLFKFHVRSTSQALDLLYQFDAVGYFHAAQDRTQEGPIDRGKFIKKGPLWRAIAAEKRSVVLIDEIDKAPKDFPNDLLNVLDQYRFEVRETGEEIKRPKDAPPPLVVVTSNSEQRLPAPFLRRCIFHHIELTDDLVRRAAAARAGDFPHLDEDTRRAAIDVFLELRKRDLRKKPAISELLVWLTLLSARGGISAGGLRKTPLGSLPALSALLKDREDLASLSAARR
jgi:MoxR-like ATPase